MSDATELVTAFEGRFPAKAILNLTRWDDNSVTSPDSTSDTRLLNAATDAIAMFKAHQLVYDSDQEEHVAIAIDLTRFILIKRKAGGLEGEVYDEYRLTIETLERMRERAAIKSSTRGKTSFLNNGANNSRRFPNTVMNLVRKPPPNPNSL